MFELDYNLTHDDMKTVNARVVLTYVLLYGAVAIIGIAVGCIAIALTEEKFLFVLGIILLVLGILLSVCSLLLLFAPKTTLESIVPISNAPMNVKIDHDSMTINNIDGETTELSYSDATAVKKYKEFTLVYFGKTRVLTIKTNGMDKQKKKQLFEFISKRQGRVLPPSMTESEQPQEQAAPPEEKTGE